MDLPKVRCPYCGYVWQRRKPIRTIFLTCPSCNRRFPVRPVPPPSPQVLYGEVIYEGQSHERRGSYEAVQVEHDKVKEDVMSDGSVWGE